MEDKEKYISLTKSLDSLRDVALAEIRLIESEKEKTEFAEFMRIGVIRWLGEIAQERGSRWKEMNDAQSKKFAKHAETLLSNPSADCPPGFIEVDGICVPI